MRYLYVFFFVGFALSPIFSQLNMNLVAQLDYSQSVNDVWGYEAPDGTEYAIVGLQDGISFVSLADPANPVEVVFESGVSTTWRDIKTWGQYAYAINEAASGGTLQIFDLSNLPMSVSMTTWNDATGVGTLTDCHNLYIDEFGFVYMVGCNLNSGGLVIADLNNDPANPVFAGIGAATYSHDVYVRGNYAYCSEIYAGQFAIYDVSDKSNILYQGASLTTGQFTHNAWLSDDGNTLFTTDETGNSPVGAYDVSDPTDIQELDLFRPLESLGMGVVPHNVHVKDDCVFTSYYTSGIVVIDGSRPSNMIEIANYDTSSNSGGGFSGAWGAYPFLESGLILVSDRQSGLFVLSIDHVQAAWLEGNITEIGTGTPVNGATIQIVSTLSEEKSNVQGFYATGTAIAGTYTVIVSAIGYESVTTTAVLVNGELTILDVELIQIALDVELLDFNAKRLDKNTVLLDWVVEQDESTKAFEIEQKFEEGSFKFLTSVNANGLNSNVNYQFEAENSFDGDTYYRLKLINEDGSYAYSKIKVVGNHLDGPSVHVFPNPVSQNLNLNLFGFNSTDQIEVIVFDTNGREIIVENIGAQDASYSIDAFEHLPKGVYYLSLQSNQFKYQEVIVKK